MNYLIKLLKLFFVNFFVKNLNLKNFQNLIFYNNLIEIKINYKNNLNFDKIFSIKYYENFEIFLNLKNYFHKNNLVYNNFYSKKILVKIIIFHNQKLKFCHFYQLLNFVIKFHSKYFYKKNLL